jgi:hypothetical protein
MEISVATRVLRGFHATLWCLARKYRALSKGNPLTVAHTAALESAAWYPLLDVPCEFPIPKSGHI